MMWVARILGILGLIVVGWGAIAQLPAVVHGHPAYAMMLVLTLLGSVGAIWLHRRPRPPTTGFRRVGSIALVLGAIGWLAAVAAMRPFSADATARAAMRSDASVQVTESATRVVLDPVAGAATTGVLFQPGAFVEARAYAAVLRPLAESGSRVVVVKQPLGIAFLAAGALDSVRDEHPDIESWVLGGHSLGGTVAAIQAEGGGGGAPGDAPAVGLMLHASYPAGDLSDSLGVPAVSIYGSADGLATPADIDASRANLPADTQFVEIEGAIHSFFGDYGLQPGDGQPGISRYEARTRISNASVDFVRSLTVTSGSAG
jgi:pimeloyl-ACP methyl ester carboxylesterase